LIAYDSVQIAKGLLLRLENRESAKNICKNYAECVSTRLTVKCMYAYLVHVRSGLLGRADIESAMREADTDRLVYVEHVGVGIPRLGVEVDSA
jgi:hypothetical protein